MQRIETIEVESLQDMIKLGLIKEINAYTSFTWAAPCYIREPIPFAALDAIIKPGQYRRITRMANEQR